MLFIFLTCVIDLIGCLLSLSLCILFLFPQDVSRVINCNVSSVSSLDDQMPGTCYDEIFNFLTSFDVEALPPKLLDEEEVPQLPNVTFAELIEVLMVNSTIPTQQVLFDLPYYYFGK